MWWLSDDPEALWEQFGIKADPALELSLELEHVWEALVGRSDGAWLARDENGDDGRVVVHVARAESSRYDVMKEGLDHHRPLPRLLACVSGSGSGFHGHRSRSWAAAPGNLHLSIMVRQQLYAGRVGVGLSMLPVVAVAGLLADMLPGEARPGIKWVNDLIIDGRKVGGVLASSQVRGVTIDECLFGIGLNVESTPEIEPSVFVPGATCLAEWMDEPPSLGFLVADFIERIEDLIQELSAVGPLKLHETYCRFAQGIGEEVFVWLDEPTDPLTRDPHAQGRLLAIRPDLSLEIADAPRPVNRGRLAFREDVEKFREKR